MRAVLVTLLILSISTVSLGCSCRFETFSINHILNSNLVIKGIALSNKQEGNNMVYQFEIKQIIRGNNSTNYVEILTPSLGPACGVNFTLNKEVIIFAYFDEDRNYTTNLCRKNKYIDSITAEYQNVIDEFQTFEGPRFWQNIKGDTVAYGEINNCQPSGTWKIFKHNQLYKEGQFELGHKHGAWKRYSVNSRMEQLFSVIKENQKQSRSRKIIYCIDFSYGVLLEYYRE